jgi:hypothetical protein
MAVDPRGSAALAFGGAKTAAAAAAAADGTLSDAVL